MGEAVNVLELRGVASKNKGRDLREISMRLAKGDFVSILCPDSKDDAMEVFNLFSFLDKPSKGSIVLDGEELTRMKEKDIERRRLSKVGLIFPTPKMMQTITIKDNIMLLMREAGVPKYEAEERAMELIDSVGLSSKSDMLPSALTTFELQKVAIARSLANEPKVLIANDPTSALKPDLHDEVIEGLRKSSKEGKAVVIITTKPEVAKKADRQMKLHDGKIVPM